MINEEVELFIDDIKKTMDKPIDFINQFNLPILNDLWRVTVSQRFDQHCEEVDTVHAESGRPFKYIDCCIPLDCCTPN